MTQIHPIPTTVANHLAPSLTQLTIHLTQGCNLDCRHCRYASRYDPEGNRYTTLSVSLFEHAILEAKQLGLQRVKLAGGEPLLHPDFLWMLEILKSEGLDLILETNGVLMTSEIAQSLAELEQCVVVVGLDGADAPTHEYVRGIPAIFDRTQWGIMTLAKYGIRPQVTMSLMRVNVDQIMALVRLVESWRVQSVKFDLLRHRVENRSFDTKGEILGVEELIQLGQHICSEVVPKTDLDLYFNLPMAFQPHWEKRMDGSCSIFNNLNVLFSGKYSLCSSGLHGTEIAYGDVGVNDLAEIWIGNEVLNRLRESVPDQLTGVCAACGLKADCIASCIAHNYFQAGSFIAPHWFCQEAYEKGMFPQRFLQPFETGEELLAA